MTMICRRCNRVVTEMTAQGLCWQCNRKEIKRGKMDTVNRRILNASALLGGGVIRPRR